MKPTLMRRVLAGAHILSVAVAIAAVAVHGDPRDTKRDYGRAELVDEVALRIDLGPASPPSRTRSRPLSIGFHRAVPAAVGALALEAFCNFWLWPQAGLEMFLRPQI